MRLESSGRSDQEIQGFFQKSILRWVILGFLFTIAFCIRIYQIDEPPLDFFPTRQYRSALIARAYYYQTLKTIPDWKKEVAIRNAQREGILEPPIMEAVTSILFRIAANEHLWIPRGLSSLFWLIGGGFVYLIATRVDSKDAAVVATAFYLFLPFGISASRSFQPGPLMVMMLLVSIFAIIWYHQRPSMHKLLTAAIASAIAILVKPVCLFVIFGAFVSLVTRRPSTRQATTIPDWLIFAVIALLPSLFFYSYGIFVARFLRSQAQASFIPHLLLEPHFWKFWLKHIYRATGFTALIGALWGLLMFREGWRRRLMLGLWIGYFVFGLVFTYHIHTHLYYQSQLVPIVALSLGPVGALLLKRLAEVNRRWHRRIAIWGILLLALFLNIGLYIQERQDLPEFDGEIRIAQEIGQAVAHSRETIFLSPNGQSLRYYGEFSGDYWPDTGEIRASQLWGERDISVEERFGALTLRKSPEYFVVTDLGEFEAQQELKRFLESNFPVLIKNDEYIIFDLRKEIDSNIQ